MRPYAFWVALIWGILMLGHGAHAWASEFGPFRGKIVDADTKEPIAGVVVLIEWHQIHPLRGGSSFYDAQETVTDKHGEFYIPGIWSLNPLVWIRTEAYVTIFKSGYGTIRGTWKALLDIELGAPKGTYILKIENDIPVFILEKLIKREERWRRIPSTPFVPFRDDDPRAEKWRLLRQEIEKEKKILEHMK
jgi:hypothetical protein